MQTQAAKHDNVKTPTPEGQPRLSPADLRCTVGEGGEFSVSILSWPYRGASPVVNRPCRLLSGVTLNSRRRIPLLETRHWHSAVFVPRDGGLAGKRDAERFYRRVKRSGGSPACNKTVQTAYVHVYTLLAHLHADAPTVDGAVNTPHRYTCQEKTRETLPTRMNKPNLNAQTLSAKQHFS